MRISRPRPGTVNRFINNTELDEVDARKAVSRFRDMVVKGENDVRTIRQTAEENLRVYKNEIWDDQDLDLFEALDATPHRFAYARVYMNNLATRQRNRRVMFKFTPTDRNAYEQFRRGREEYVRLYGNQFPSLEEAVEYYDHHANDKMADALTAVVHNSRQKSGAKYVESETFEMGIASSAHFMKTTISNAVHPDGAMLVDHRGVDQMFWDRSDKTYELRDIDYIGEIHRMYVQDMINQWPDLEEEIEAMYGDRTNMERTGRGRISEQWQDYYKFADQGDTAVKIAELWFKDTEQRFKVYDQENDEERLIAHEIENEDEIRVGLMKQVLVEMLQYFDRHGDLPEWVEDPELLNKDDGYIQAYLDGAVAERFHISTTRAVAWMKAVFTHNALFELRRSPLAHSGHPYTPYFPQFVNGYPTGLIDDIRDPLIALNKALVFRELMMAHGAKGLIVANEDMFKESGYTTDQIAEAYTQLGGMLFIKPKRGQNIDQAILPITTVGQGLVEMNSIIQDYRNMIREISGVTLAQMGEVQGETPASRYQMQLSEGDANNGIMFDNFYRTLEEHYAKKVAPLGMWMLRNRKHLILRILDDSHRPWIEIDSGDDFGIYQEYDYGGGVDCTLEPVRENPVIDEARSSKLLELAMQRPDQVPVDFAIKYMNIPNSQDVLRDLQQFRKEFQMEQARNQIDIEQLYQMIQSDSDISPEVAERIIKQVKAQAMQQFEQGQGGRPPNPNQIVQGAQEIREGAADMQRQQLINESVQ